MRAFADDEDDIVHRLFRELREQPSHKRANDARRTLEGHCVAGRAENQRHPEEHRKPIPEEGFDFRHGAWKQSSRVWSNDKQSLVLVLVLVPWALGPTSSATYNICQS